MYFMNKNNVFLIGFFSGQPDQKLEDFLFPITRRFLWSRRGIPGRLFHPLSEWRIRHERGHSLLPSPLREAGEEKSPWAPREGPRWRWAGQSGWSLRGLLNHMQHFWQTSNPLFFMAFFTVSGSTGAESLFPVMACAAVFAFIHIRHLESLGCLFHREDRRMAILTF